MGDRQYVCVSLCVCVLGVACFAFVLGLVTNVIRLVLVRQVHSFLVFFFTRHPAYSMFEIGLQSVCQSYAAAL